MNSKNLLSRFVLPVLLCFGSAAFAQPENTSIENELIVRLKPNYSLENFFIDAKKSDLDEHEISFRNTIIPEWNLHLVRVAQSAQVEAVLKKIRHLPGVQHAYRNKKVTFRTTPDDPNFLEQWNMQILGLETVWDATTGGVSAEGDTIVVAILDSGFDVNHDDLIENIWKNREEIENDGIDNDGNGLIDDVTGWNFALDRQNFTVGSHGTSVTGIIGARGNNGKYTSGVNWRVKLMLLQIDSSDKAVAAYYYVLKKRRDYNRTGGAKGAFVVVTNASFGIDQPTPCIEYPDWLAVYDSLGSEGVLSVAATSNDRIDVDELGDTPSGCPSDYLITVTNTNREDRLATAGFGKKNIDLGAPGDGTVTIRSLNGVTNNFPGTSASSPHVAGAVALLYSAPCEKLIASFKQAPSATALLMKNWILQGVDKLPDLENKTVTGGRLNVKNSLELISEYCEVKLGPLEILGLRPNPTTDELNVFYQIPDFEDCRIRLFDALGKLYYDEIFTPSRFGEGIKKINLGGLSSGIYFVTISKGKDVVTKKVLKY